MRVLSLDCWKVVLTLKLNPKERKTQPCPWRVAEEDKKWSKFFWEKEPIENTEMSRITPVRHPTRFPWQSISQFSLLALSLAASGGYVNIIRVLLNAGAEINSRSVEQLSRSLLSIQFSLRRTGSKLGITVSDPAWERSDAICCVSSRWCWLPWMDMSLRWSCCSTWVQISMLRSRRIETQHWHWRASKEDPKLSLFWSIEKPTSNIGRKPVWHHWWNRVRRKELFQRCRNENEIHLFF